jgi:hypothetical protein
VPTATASTGHCRAVSGVGDAALLQSYAVAIEDISWAQNLRDAVSQVETGMVQHIRDHYGPKDGRHNADPMWKNLKGKVTKHEHLYTVLMEDFEGDHGWFFHFFTVALPSVKRPTTH